jgi:DNA-binding transcriptional MerR regulator
MIKKLLLPPFKVNPFIIKDNMMDDNIHIVSTALKKGGFCIHYLSNRGMSTYQIADFCDTVNNKPEVGTLYPKFPFSFLPIIHLDSKNFTDFIHKHIQEVLKAHRLYYKNCTSILFVIDREAGYPIDNIQSILENCVSEILNTEFTDLNNIEIYYTIYP